MLNKWIRLCGGALGIQVVIVAKSHQENTNGIKHFVWQMCISYRGLKRVTKV